MKTTQTISRWLLGLLFIAAGVNHFLNPGFYVRVMPPYLPWREALVYVSGFFEVLGGFGLLTPRLRRAAGWGLIALLVAVSPVHFHMLAHADDYPAIPWWLLVARVPLQAVFMAWVYWAAISPRDATEQEG